MQADVYFVGSLQGLFKLKRAFGRLESANEMFIDDLRLECIREI